MAGLQFIAAPQQSLSQPGLYWSMYEDGLQAAVPGNFNAAYAQFNDNGVALTPTASIFAGYSVMTDPVPGETGTGLGASGFHVSLPGRTVAIAWDLYPPLQLPQLHWNQFCRRERLRGGAAVQPSCRPRAGYVGDDVAWLRRPRLCWLPALQENWRCRRRLIADRQTDLKRPEPSPVRGVGNRKMSPQL